MMDLVIVVTELTTEVFNTRATSYSPCLSMLKLKWVETDLSHALITWLHSALQPLLQIAG